MPKGVPVFCQEYAHLGLRPKNVGGVLAAWTDERYFPALSYWIDAAATSAAFNVQRNKAELGIAFGDKPECVNFS